MISFHNLYRLCETTRRAFKTRRLVLCEISFSKLVHYFSMQYIYNVSHQDGHFLCWKVTFKIISRFSSTNIEYYYASPTKLPSERFLLAIFVAIINGLRKGMHAIKIRVWSVKTFLCSSDGKRRIAYRKPPRCSSLKWSTTTCLHNSMSSLRQSNPFVVNIGAEWSTLSMFCECEHVSWRLPLKKYIPNHVISSPCLPS